MNVNLELEALRTVGEWITEDAPDHAILAPAGTEHPTVAERRRVSSGSPWEPKVGICRALREGDRVLVSGTAPIWPDGSCDPDADVQTRRCLEIITRHWARLGAAPSTSCARACSSPTPRTVRPSPRSRRVLRPARPVSTMVVVSGFLDPRWKVEIEAEAIVD